ncbi:MAG TPA: SDR family oxidoreductase, partial [Methylovorus sp.]|nr:SDR family oxidoreductase [Methylovorus sp.]
MKILVTGVNGFVSKAICARFINEGLAVRGSLRSESQQSAIIDIFYTGELTPYTNWAEGLQGIDVVIHLAARVHVMSDTSADPLQAFRRVNVDATLNLARQAAAMGVKRFIFLSSIKVNGEATLPGQAFYADDRPAPGDAYGISKYEAEQALLSLAKETGMEVVIIRPPLVYGPGVKANFASMMRWLERGIPLPLAAITHNRRSLVSLDNLVDLIVTCLDHPAAANQIFLVRDGEDMSTVELLKRMGMAQGTPARLFYLPLPLLKWGAILLNKPGIYQRLCGSLQVDITKTQELLGWRPPISVDEGLRRAAQKSKGYK